MKNLKVTAILACAGKGSRAKQNNNKIFSIIDNEPVIVKTVLAFENAKVIDEIIIVHAKGEDTKIKQVLPKLTKKITYIEGGETRFQSVKNALFTLNEGAVLIHDGARPYIDEKTIVDCVFSIKKFGSGVVCSTPTDTIIETDNNLNILVSTRKNRFLAQTPQGFMVKDLKRAYTLASEEDNFTDDAGVYTAFIGKCKAVLCNSNNKKLTYPEDFSDNKDFVVGTGFDLHVLTENRKLILGGIEIPHTKGLLGHSDADVLTHAIMDAMLSSLSLRDIGYHFSDKDEKYKDISSMILLDKVLKMITDKGYKVNNISAVIMAQKPKLSPYVEKITLNLAKALNIESSQIGITCTTLEGIGIVGREEGIAVQCYCSLKTIN